MLKHSMSIAAAAAISVLALAGCSSPSAPNGQNSAGGDACEIVRGKTVELIVPYSTGGGYDTLARIVAPGLSETLGTNVIVVNQPGAGGLLAINQLASAAPTDGTRIAIMNGTGAAASVVVGAEGVEFGFDDLSYIGRVSVDDLLVVTNAEGPYQSWDDVLDSSGFRFASTGRGASDYVVANTLIETFELEGAEVVAGFAGQSESDLALLQGNVDAITGPIDSRRPGIVGGETKGVLTFAAEAPAEASDAAIVRELELDERQQALVDGLLLLNELGRLIVGPAGMDEGALSCLRGALEEALQVPSVVEQSEQMERGFDFLSGTALERDVVPHFATLPDEFVEVLRASY